MPEAERMNYFGKRNIHYDIVDFKDTVSIVPVFSKEAREEVKKNLYCSKANLMDIFNYNNKVNPRLYSSVSKLGNYIK